ncbi:helix-turn-helix transcriptional regulator [Glycocaulis sp.]
MRDYTTQRSRAGIEEEEGMKAGPAIGATSEPAIFLVSHNMTVRSTNMVASELVKRNSCLAINDGRLTGLTEKIEHQLRSMIAAANDRGHRALIQCPAAPPRAPDRDWIAVSRRFGHEGQAEGLTMLSLRPLVRAEPMLGREVMWIFGLTAAEARVAVQLAGGFTLAEIAEANGVNISTLQAQLRSVYAKTGTGKQSELVSRIWRAASL